MGLMNDVLAGMCFLLFAVVICNHVRFVPLLTVMLAAYVAAFFVVLDKCGLVVFATGWRSLGVVAAQFTCALLLLLLCCKVEKVVCSLYIRTFKRQVAPAQFTVVTPHQTPVETVPVQTEAA